MGTFFKQADDAARRLAPVLESAELDSSAVSSPPLYRSYRDSIRRVSVGPACSSARFFLFPSTSDGEQGSSSSSSYGWSSIGSSSLHSRMSASSADDYYNLSFPDADGVHELRAIALRMVKDGYMHSLLRAFRGGGADFVGGRGSDDHHDDELLLQRWFSELDVEWVLSSGGDDDRLQLQLGSLEDLMERWTRALLTMAQVLCIILLELRAKRPAVGGVIRAIQQFLRRQIATPASAAAGETPPEYSDQKEEVTQFAQFAEASILRMLAFVDAVAEAAALNDHRTHLQAPETLPGMLQVCACVADASPTILSLFKVASNLLEPSSARDDEKGHHTHTRAAAITTTVFDAMNGVFLRKRKKLSDAIWSMMQVAKGSLLTEDRWQVPLSPEAGVVHETTELMMNYIMLLRRYDSALNVVLQDHHFSLFVSEDEGFNSVVNLIVDMISCLEKQIEDTSCSYADRRLQCIFFMNNWDFVLQKIDALDLASWTRIDGCKIDKYIERYLDASWAPVISCLFVDMPFGIRRYTCLSKFETKFLTTYESQRLWKVPNPELRKRLRRAIIDKVIPCYTSYLEQRLATGKSKTSPSSTPVELVEQLEELFEG